MDVPYVHVKRTATGADDMVPERSAHLLADIGKVEIVDPEPGRYRRFKPRLPLGESVSPKRKKTTRVVTESAPAQGATTAEEATE